MDTTSSTVCRQKRGEKQHNDRKLVKINNAKRRLLGGTAAKIRLPPPRSTCRDHTDTHHHLQKSPPPTPEQANLTLKPTFAIWPDLAFLPNFPTNLLSRSVVIFITVLLVSLVDREIGGCSLSGRCVECGSGNFWRRWRGCGLYSRDRLAGVRQANRSCARRQCNRYYYLLTLAQASNSHLFLISISWRFSFSQFPKISTV